jgi:hypothetical protein
MGKPASTGKKRPPRDVSQTAVKAVREITGSLCGGRSIIAIMNQHQHLSILYDIYCTKL